MTDTMNHEQFLAALEELESDFGAWRQALPARAVSHAEVCASCLQLAEGLALFREDPDDALGAPPEGYWSDFQARLDQRLPARDKEREGSPWPALLSGAGRRWLGLAAAVLLALALPQLLSQAPEAPDALRVSQDPTPDLQATGGELPAEAAASLPEDFVLASFAGDGILWSLEESEFDSSSTTELDSLEESSFAVDGDAEDYEAAIDSAFDGMNEQEATDLLRLLRAEMAS